jgi:predicted AlkP superfamily phosphohydrolase/phosphomutase
MTNREARVFPVVLSTIRIHPLAPMSETPAPPKILLVGLELADWKLLHPLVDGGYLPNLDRLINGGVIADVSAGTWRTMATGQPDPPPAGVPLWDTFAQAGRRCLVVRWPGSHPASVLPAGGIFISEEFNRPERPDIPAGPSVAPEGLVDTMNAMRVAATGIELDDLRSFVPTLDQLGEEDRPIITWLAQALADVATTQRIATYLLEKEQPWDFAMIHYGALGAISRQFLALSQKPGGAYGGVPTGAVILADQMLGRVLELAGPDTITCVCSAYGLFGNAAAVLAGPGLRQDERLEEKGGKPASVLDIAPTLCALAGLPAPEGMTGSAWDVRLET